MPGRATRRNVDVFVEIQKGSRAKYERDQVELAGWRGSRTAWSLIETSRAQA